MQPLEKPPPDQCLAAWDDEIILVRPPAGWEERGVADTYTSLPMGSYGYLLRQVRLSALTPRSPFVRLFAPARPDIADEVLIFPFVSHDTYLFLLETLWAIRARLLREPVLEPSRGWRRRVPRRNRPKEEPEAPLSPYRMGPSQPQPPPPKRGATFSLGRLARPLRPHVPDYVIGDATSAYVIGNRLVVENELGKQSVPLDTFTSELRFIRVDEYRHVLCTDLHFGSRCVLRLGADGIPAALDEALPARADRVSCGTAAGVVEIRDAL